MTFLLATPVLFILIAVLIIAIAVSVEIEEQGWATGFFSISIALLLWHYWSDIWGWIASNPRDTLIFLGGYIIIGIIWALVKWKSYIAESARHFKLIGENFKREVGEIGANWGKWIKVLNDNSAKLKVEWFTSFSESDEPDDVIKKITIQASKRKATIVSWISYWPMSIAATLLNDPIRRFFSWVYEGISGVFQRMSNSSTNGLADAIDMKKNPEEHQNNAKEGQKK